MAESKPKQVGEPFKRLFSFPGRKPEHRTVANYICECGVTFEATVTSVEHGHRTTCGCSAKAIGRRSRTHGMSKTPTYRIWCGMWRRCTDDTSNSFGNYGGRGIGVCDRWKDFAIFLEDMGERPKGMSIDRIDNDGNYDPANCRWSTPKEQGRNTSRNTVLECNGKRATMAEWAEVSGVDKRVFYNRLKRGWTIEQATSGIKPKRRNGAAKITQEIADAIRLESGSTRDIASKYGISQTQVRNILSGRHWK